MRIMQVNWCDIRNFFYLPQRCLNLFLGWLFIGLTPAFSNPAILPISHFSLPHFQSPLPGFYPAISSLGGCPSSTSQHMYITEVWELWVQRTCRHWSGDEEGSFFWSLTSKAGLKVNSFTLIFIQRLTNTRLKQSWPHCSRFVYILRSEYKIQPFSDKKMQTTRKCGNCECIATWGRRTACQSFWAVLGQFCIAHAQKLLYISLLPIKIPEIALDSATPIS